MLKITSIVVALCLIQYAQAAVSKVPPRSCHVSSPKEFLERFKKDHNALSCVARTPRESFSDELAYCECTYDTEGSITKILGFNVIVFGDFTTHGGQDILGRLAIQGNFNAPNYLVNANTQPVCYAENIVPWDNLALAVGGNIISTDTKVHGHWWAAGSGAAIQLNENCNSPAKVDSPFPFSGVLSDLLSISERLSTQKPDLLLAEDGDLTLFDDISTNCYHIMTLSPCRRDPLVCFLLGQLSSPKAILFGIGNWNGPNKPYPSDGKVVIINVPVFNGDTFEIATNQPSQGADSCKLIWNFYPVDESGNYLSTGSFTIIRHTGSPFAGVVFAPLGDIIDGSSSVFEGAFFAKSYIWEQQNGVEIHDTPPCNNYHFCLPDVTTQPPEIEQQSFSTTPSSVPPMTSTTTNQYSSESSSMTSSTITTTATGINQESNIFPLGPFPLMTSPTTNQYSSESSSMTSSTTVPTTTTPGPESTSDATVHNTHTHHTYHHDHDHGHHWHDKDDDKDWHKKDEDKDWHKKDDDEDWHKKDDEKDSHKKEDDEDWHKKEDDEDWHKKEDDED
ncbi:hypothetical protein INT44_008822 [Umbelopsis vinacea]|uniref:Choice-of-anchor A domain-containing protein n=1 Tax=Umbelopsis vinacea TaxID=44442 RepID=A0A8H7U889_9FUNG|nr:hypothetical protein INT44_008822 [Umbelopsis vinacea]